MPLAFILSPIQLTIVAIIVLLLFGNRLPNVMRGLGEGLGEFKKGIDSIGNVPNQINREVRNIEREIVQPLPPPQRNHDDQA